MHTVIKKDMCSVVVMRKCRQMRTYLVRREETLQRSPAHELLDKKTPSDDVLLSLAVCVASDACRPQCLIFEAIVVRNNWAAMMQLDITLSTSELTLEKRALS